MQIRNRIKEILHPFFQKQFVSFRSITESFLVKPGNTAEELLLHQDWCYTDERHFHSFNVWIPLDDVTEKNGALYFLPGSHRWFNNLRSSGLSTARIESAGVLAPYIRAVSIKKGQVAVFNPAVFHGSFPNNSNEPRIAVTSTVLPVDAPFSYYQKSDRNNEVKVFELDDDCFLRELANMAVGGDPALPVKNNFPYHHLVPTIQDLLEKAKI